MKKLLILLFSILISFNSYGEWTEITISNTGNTHYIDNSSFKENNGYIYWWELNDYLIPSEWGDMSDKQYKQGDCKVNRYKILSFIFHKQSMGIGIGEQSVPLGSNGDWNYPSPGTVGTHLINHACNLRN